jgi:hypothetical protein
LFERNRAAKRKSCARICSAQLHFLCGAKNRFIKRRLVQPARLLRCVPLDAAMHNRNSGTGPQIGFDFGVKQAQHQTNAIDVSLRRRFELRCSLKK